jgi:hypothetical protein
MKDIDKMEKAKRESKGFKNNISSDSFHEYDYDTDDPKLIDDIESLPIENPFIYMPNCECREGSQTVIEFNKKNTLTDHFSFCKKCSEKSLKLISDNLLSNN